MIGELKKYDYARLEKFIVKYDEYKRGLKNNEYSERMEQNIKNTVDSFDRLYSKLDEQPKQIVYMTWFEPESDSVICEVLDIPYRRLLCIRKIILNMYAEEMVYI